MVLQQRSEQTITEVIQGKKKCAVELNRCAFNNPVTTLAPLSKLH